VVVRAGGSAEPHAASGGQGWRRGAVYGRRLQLHVAAGSFSTPVGTGTDTTVGGSYHFRRHAVFPWVVCASDGLQSGNVCRVTRVGSRNPACWLEMGCG